MIRWNQKPPICEQDVIQKAAYEISKRRTVYHVRVTQKIANSILYNGESCNFIPPHPRFCTNLTVYWLAFHHHHVGPVCFALAGGKRGQDRLKHGMSTEYDIPTTGEVRRSHLLSLVSNFALLKVSLCVHVSLCSNPVIYLASLPVAKTLQRLIYKL